MEILTGNMNRLKNILVFLSSSLLVLSLYSCSSKSDQDPQVDEGVQPSVPVQKKILYSQRTQGGKNAINVIEEQQGHKRTLRIIVQRGDLNSNLVHPIDSPNFVIAIPLQDATSKQFAEQTVLFEQQLKKDVDAVLGRYLAPERFNVSLLVQWNQKLLEEIQLRNVPLDIPVTELLADGKARTQMLLEEVEGPESAYGNHPELKMALTKIEFKVLLDNTLPGNQEKFIQQLIPSQDFFDQTRGDLLSLERTSFPNPYSDSIAPYEEQVITKKIRELVENYISPETYVLNVDFKLLEKEEGEENENNEGSRLQMDIKLLLDETILPEVDNFLKQALPLSIDFKPEQGDTLTIVRNRFPEQSAELMSQEQLSALREYRVKILEAFKSGDYVSGLELTEECLKVAAKRDDKIFLLKMKGSLHFLLEEKKRALETWKHVLRLNPEDEEVAQMISSLD